MAKTRKPVIDNPVYSEIILRLRDEEVYVSKFCEEFVNDNFIFTGKGDERRSHKPQSLLSRQMDYLEKQGYLISRSEEQGKRFENNKRLFRVNFERIIDDYIDFLIEKNDEHVEKKKRVAIEKEDIENLKFAVERRDDIRSSDFRQKAKKNPYIKLLFKDVIVDHVHASMIDLRTSTLREVFEHIIGQNRGEFMSLFEEYFKDELLKIYPKTGNLRPEDRSFMNKAYRKDIEFFLYNFCPAHDYSDMTGAIIDFRDSAARRFAVRVVRGPEVTDEEMMDDLVRSEK